MFKNLRTLNRLTQLNLRHAKNFQTKSIRSLLELDSGSGEKVRVVGWVKSFRDQKEVKFVHVNDGSDHQNLQLVISMENFKDEKLNSAKESLSQLHLNTAIEAFGNLMTSTHRKQRVELHVDEIKVISQCEPSEYPFQTRIKYNLEQLRSHTHLRTHIDTFANILKFRSELTNELHQFFHSNHFYQIHTPILTANNCEGGCETFEAITSKDKAPSTAQNSTFFQTPVYLTASAQLHLETMTTTLGKVYTLSPTFRAEKSMTRHHLAEFYMLEAEMVDMNNLDQLTNFVETMLKEVGRNLFDKLNKDFLSLLVKTDEKNSAKKMNYVEFILNVLEKDFVRVSYTEALEILNKISLKKKKQKLEFGEDLSKEQEKLLVEYFENRLVFVVNYPKTLKPFYMRENEQSKELVDNFDLLAPFVGEIVGGSLREHRVDLLEDAMKRKGLNLDNYKMYLETKRFGAMKMAGFGLGLERLIQFLINVENIRDTCAFPRSLHNCKM